MSSANAVSTVAHAAPAAAGVVERSEVKHPAKLANTLYKVVSSPKKLTKGKARRNRGRDVIPMAVLRSIPASIQIRHRFRFIATAGETMSITLQNLFGALGGIGTISNSTVTLFASSFRLRRLTIAESAQNVATVSSEILWYSAADVNSPDKVNMNSTIPYDRPSVVSETPPAKSLASFWWNTSATLSTILFSLTVSIGSIIEADMEFTLPNNAPSFGLTGFTTVAVGTVYYLALDGRASNKLIPVGLPTTA